MSTHISYGKLVVPVHRIEGDDVFACEVDVEVLGDNFAPAYTEGDNSNVVATDTMKNFILREAAAHDGASLEGFLAFLGERMIATYPVMEALRVSGRELAVRPPRRQGVRAFGGRPWARLRAGGARRGERRPWRPPRPDAAQDPRQRIHPLRARRVHDAARARRPAAVHPARRRLALRGHRRLRRLARRPRPPGRHVRRLRLESIQHLVHEMGTRLLADHEQLAEVAFTAENHTRDPVGEQDGRKVYTDPFPAQGLITLTLTR